MLLGYVCVCVCGGGGGGGGGGGAVSAWRQWRIEKIIINIWIFLL